jgi:hypothetical protein
MRMEVDTVSPPLAPAGARIGPKDYFNDVALAHILALLEGNTHWAVEKAEDWKREDMEQEELFDAIDSDNEYDF